MWLRREFFSREGLGIAPLLQLEQDVPVFLNYHKKIMNIINSIFTLFENIDIIAPMVVCIWAVFA